MARGVRSWSWATFCYVCGKGKGKVRENLLACS